MLGKGEQEKNTLGILVLLPFLSSFFPHKLPFHTSSWFFEGEENKKSLGVEVTNKEIPDHF